MDAHTIMRQEALRVRPEHSVLQAGRLMAEHGLYALPVVEEGQRLVGVLEISALLALALPSYLDEVEDLSFLTAAVEWSAEVVPDLSALTVGELLSRAPHRAPRDDEPEPYHGVSEDEPLVEVARLFVREGAMLCPVVRGHDLVGVIRPHDLLRVLLAPWEGTL